MAHLSHDVFSSFLAPAVTAVCMSLLGTAPSFHVLFILLLVSGLSAAAFHVPGPVLIKRYAGASTGRGMSFYMFGGEMAGAALSLLQFSGAIGTFGAGFFADRFGHRTSLLIIAVLTPLAGLALAWSPGILTLPLLVSTGFLLFASSPIQLALVQDQCTDRPAFFNSLFMTMNIVASALAVLFVGNLGDRIGLEMTFIVSAGLAFLAIPFVFLFSAKRI